MISVKGKALFFTTVTAKLEACLLTFDLWYYPQLTWYLILWLGEPEHIDFKVNLLRALTQVAVAPARTRTHDQ